MLSILTNPKNITAGASVMIFGILGGYTAYMLINWSALGKLGPIRSQLCCIIGFILFFSLLFSFGPNVDSIGHIGGLIGGFLISLAILPGL
jgi:rhomboid protease GluP